RVGDAGGRGGGIGGFWFGGHWAAGRVRRPVCGATVFFSGRRALPSAGRDLPARDRHPQACRSMLGHGQKTGSVIMTVALRLAAIAALWVGALGATTAVRAQGGPGFAAIIAAPDRSDADRETDQRRAPVK